MNTFPSINIISTVKIFFRPKNKKEIDNNHSSNEEPTINLAFPRKNKFSIHIEASSRASRMQQRQK
jgi:hypothetical protein